MPLLTTEKKYNDLPVLEKVRLMAATLHEKQARDLVGLHLHGLTSATDAMLVATATSQRHAQALADALGRLAREESLEMLGQEGYAAAQWILVDCNDVLVHIFHGDMRGLFNLEGLWIKAPRMDLGLPESARPGQPRPDPLEDDEPW